MIAYCFYALFIIVPLILTPWNSELFEFNKMLAVYALTTVIAGAWLIQSVRSKKILFKPTPLDLPLILFLASQIIATVISLDPHTSFWGYYSRFHGGLLSTICYLTLYWAYSTFMRSKTKTVITVILSTAAIVSLYGVAEHFGIDKHIWVQDVQNRVFSTLGQPNWLAAYLSAIIPISGWLSPLLLLTAWFTKSQSGWGALVIIGLLALILYFIKNRLGKILALTVLLAIGVMFAWQNHLLIPYNQIKNEVIKENQTNLGGSSSMLIRRVVWQGAIEAWKHYPLFGSGVETFAYVYYNYRPAEHNLLSEWDFLYNKAHNEYVNLLTTTGAFGLISFLYLSAAGLIFLLRRSRPLALGYTGILVTNFFGFSVVPVALLFFLYPAFALKPDKKDDGLNPPPANNLQMIVITLICLVVVFLLVGVARLWRADYLYNLGKNQVKAKLLTDGWQNLARAVALSPREPVFRNDLAETEAQLAYAYASPSAELSQQFLDQTLKDSNLVINQNAVNLNFWRTRIKIFLILAELDPSYNNQAVEAFRQAILLAPTDAKFTYNLALVYSLLGQTELAEQELIKTIELKPNYENARNSLGSLYQQTNRPELAREQYQYILDHLHPGDRVVTEKLNQL